MARDRIEWERDVIYHMECIMELTTSDAQGIFEVNHFYVTQEWGKGSEPETAARNIAEKLNAAAAERMAKISTETEFLFVPVDGYVTNEQRTIKIDQMADLNFEPEAIGWAACAKVADCRTIDGGSCKSVLIRMK
jgi:hypothetical protein